MKLRHATWPAASTPVRQLLQVAATSQSILSRLNTAALQRRCRYVLPSCRCIYFNHDPNEPLPGVLVRIRGDPNEYG